MGGLEIIWARLSLRHCILVITFRDSNNYLNLLRNAYPRPGTHLLVMSPGPSWLRYLMGAIEELSVVPTGEAGVPAPYTGGNTGPNTDLSTINAALA